MPERFPVAREEMFSYCKGVPQHCNTISLVPSTVYSIDFGGLSRFCRHVAHHRRDCLCRRQEQAKNGAYLFLHEMGSERSIKLDHDFHRTVRYDLQQIPTKMSAHPSLSEFSSFCSLLRHNRNPTSSLHSYIPGPCITMSQSSSSPESRQST